MSCPIKQGVVAPMRSKLKQVIKGALALLLKTALGRLFAELLTLLTLNLTHRVTRGPLSFVFCTPNRLSRWRAQTLFEKEPETIRWIDGFKPNSTFWDIGANVGLFNIYAAKTKHCDVYAFEPSPLNIELLARNIALNDEGQRHLSAGSICLVPIALSKKLEINNFMLSNFEKGGALSSFGTDVGHDGQPFTSVMKYKTIGLSMDEAVSRLNLPYPNYLKLDVDGIEHFILDGGETILKQVESVLVEVNDGYLEQAATCENLLEAAGLSLIEKTRSTLVDGHLGDIDPTYNQIWRRIN